MALALQNVLGDLFASLSIALDKPFVVGDRLVIDTFAGNVEHIGIKTTRMRSETGEQIILSNADVLKSRLRNFGRAQEQRSLTTIRVTYDAPAGKLRTIPALLEGIVREQPSARFERCHLKTLGDTGLQFELSYFVRQPSPLLDVQQAVNFRIIDEFERLGGGVRLSYAACHFHEATKTAGRQPSRAGEVAPRPARRPRSAAAAWSAPRPLSAAAWRRHSFRPRPPMFHVVLFEPEIPPNSGNAIRLCANTGATLHLVKPLGFRLDDRSLQRSGLDYHDLAAVKVHANLDACVNDLAGARIFTVGNRRRASLQRYGIPCRRRIRVRTRNPRFAGDGAGPLRTGPRSVSSHARRQPQHQSIERRGPGRLRGVEAAGLRRRRGAAKTRGASMTRDPRAVRAMARAILAAANAILTTAAATLLLCSAARADESARVGALRGRTPSCRGSKPWRCCRH